MICPYSEIRMNQSDELRMKFDKELVDSIKGFLDETEGDKLYEIGLAASQKGPCLEIGSYCGKSAVYLGTACKENNTVLYSIDHHRGSEEQQKGEAYFDADLYDADLGCIDTFGLFRKTIEAFDLLDALVPMVCHSTVAARKWATPLSLVFIDGGHSFETAFNDYNCWSRHIMPGGYLLIHDIFKRPDQGGQAPYQVYKYALASGLYKPFSQTKSLGILRKLDCGEHLE